MSFRITGLDKLRRDLQQASEAFRALDGEIASVRFDPADLSSVEVAISEMEQAMDRRIAPFSDNELVRNMMTELKAKYRDQILERAANASSKREDDPVAETTIDQGMLRQIENTVTDLRRAEYNTFAQHIRKLSRLLHSPALEEINRGLTDGIDLEAWLTAGVATEGSMAGSARLEWPSDPEKELGTVVLLIDKFAGNPDEATGFARTFYYTGSSSLSGSLQNIVGQMIVPFTRDYIDHVKAKTGTVEATLLPERKAPAVRKAFVVHGHDEGVRGAVVKSAARGHPNRGRRPTSEPDGEEARLRARRSRPHLVAGLARCGIGPGAAPRCDHPYRRRRTAFFEAGFVAVRFSTGASFAAAALCRTAGLGFAAGACSASGAGFAATGRICPSSNARSWPSTALLTR